MISVDGSLIIQLANFLILIWILNLVLYKPIRNIIIQRKEKISGLESDIDSAETKAVEQDQAFADGIKDARTKGLKQKEALLQAAADEEKAIIGQINEKAQAELTKIREQIAGEANEANIAVGTGANSGGLNATQDSTDVAVWVGSAHDDRATAPFRVLADGGEQPGYILAEVDPAEVIEARRMIPALEHDRAFDQPLKFEV